MIFGSLAGRIIGTNNGNNIVAFQTKKHGINLKISNIHFHNIGVLQISASTKITIDHVQASDYGPLLLIGNNNLQLLVSGCTFKNGELLLVKSYSPPSPSTDTKFVFSNSTFHDTRMIMMDIPNKLIIHNCSFTTQKSLTMTLIIMGVNSVLITRSIFSGPGRSV